MLAVREERDLYNENLEKTGLTYFKGDKNLPVGCYPMVVMIVIQNSLGEFLMQKRSERKGGDWGVTGGHPKAGETPEEGIVTEVKEELGIDISNQKLIEFDRGCDYSDCFIRYYVNMDFDVKDLKIQLDELSEARWFSMEELEKMVETKELQPNQISCFKKYVEFSKSKQKKL